MRLKVVNNNVTVDVEVSDRLVVSLVMVLLLHFVG
jgi:hypothetical protein